MTAIQPGAVVVAHFLGARQAKPRPAVVISTDPYHSLRPDVILAILTTQMPTPLTPFDYLLQDWVAAGLHQPSVFRVYLGMAEARHVIGIGQLSDRDWQEIQARLRLALAVT
jgi:mRNA interferase MazF